LIFKSSYCPPGVQLWMLPAVLMTHFLGFSSYSGPRQKTQCSCPSAQTSNGIPTPKLNFLTLSKNRGESEEWPACPSHSPVKKTWIAALWRLSTQAILSQIWLYVRSHWQKNL
jgi:hypothetical protein